MRGLFALVLAAWAVGVFLGGLSVSLSYAVFSLLGSLALLVIALWVWAGRERRCPWCGQRGKPDTSDEAMLENQGRAGRRTIVRCNNCGNGMTVALVGGPRAVDPDAWAEHQAYIWEHFDSPKARERHAAEVDDIVPAP